MDEFLIPHKHVSIRALLDQLNGPGIASFSFQNSFFYLYFPNDTSIDEILSTDHEYLVTMYKTTRLVKVHHHGSRSKYVVKPENVIECGNHNIWLYKSGKKQLRVNASVALSHHYRICEFGGKSCVRQPHTVDTRAHHWAETLAHDVGSDCRKIFPNGKCY